ncbi:hypothetical protein E3_0410 [Rhodococcus phage E3]|uniref:hypothetical protein n=1 Tax=Rhodococcus phage E3 TaxID=1007869 RepID=UPI0002C6DD6C|nr:hypothetical protein M176_gp044 [Rhodococcus phage E3]AEQ20954.1 hypothetical protein E3_0410 [Rhodococcus phage E3]
MTINQRYHRRSLTVGSTQVIGAAACIDCGALVFVSDQLVHNAFHDRVEGRKPSLPQEIEWGETKTRYEKWTHLVARYGPYEASVTDMRGGPWFDRIEVGFGVPGNHEVEVWEGTIDEAKAHLEKMLRDANYQRVRANG